MKFVLPDFIVWVKYRFYIKKKKVTALTLFCSKAYIVTFKAFKLDRFKGEGDYQQLILVISFLIYHFRQMIISAHEEQLATITSLCKQEMKLLLGAKAGQRVSTRAENSGAK